MELSKLQESILIQLRKLTECRGEQSYFEFEVEIEVEDCTFIFSGDFSIDYSDKIEGFNISDSYIQFADFEAAINPDYVQTIQSEINNKKLYY